MSSPVEIEKLVVTTIARACNIDADAVTLDASILDLGIDSVVLVSIVSQMGAACRVAITADQTLDLFESDSVRNLIEKFRRIVRPADSSSDYAR